VVAPNGVAKAANSVSDAITALDKDFVNLIQFPDRGTTERLQQDTARFGQVMTDFVHAAKG